MLSRVQSLGQLYILDSVPANKIYASDIAVNELDRMEQTALNNKKSWNIAISCNIRSMSHNFQSFITTPNVLRSDVLCLQETWLTKLQKPQYDIDGFKKHFNSVGRGKGIVTYFREKYSFEADIKNEEYQMTKVSSQTVDIINIYRSRNANSNQFLLDFSQLFDPSQETLVRGDLNICWKSEKGHTILNFLEDQGFEQLVSSPTHMEGRHIDQCFLFNPGNNYTRNFAVRQKSPFFTDHNILYDYEVRNSHRVSYLTLFC